METMERSKRRDRRSYTPEFKTEIVNRCRAGDRSIAEVARDFDLTESAVRRWVAQAEIDAGERAGLTTEEREELSRLRRENKRLQADVDLLKRATAFFAKETR
jgi:transposase